MISLHYLWSGFGAAPRPNTVYERMNRRYKLTFITQAAYAPQSPQPQYHSCTQPECALSCIVGVYLIPLPVVLLCLKIEKIRSTQRNEKQLFDCIPVHSVLEYDLSIFIPINRPRYHSKHYHTWPLIGLVLPKPRFRLFPELTPKILRKYLEVK